MREPLDNTSTPLPRVARRRSGRNKPQPAPAPSPRLRADARQAMTVRRGRRLLMTLILAVSLGLGAWALWNWWTAVSAQNILTQLTSVPAHQIEPQVAKLRLLGESGREALVLALVHERVEVQQAARQQLLEEIDSWKTMSDEESSQRVALLAQQLVAVLPDTTSPSRRFISNLATDLVLWPVDPSAIDSTALLQNCDTLLRAGFQGAEDAELTAITDQVAGDDGSSETSASSPGITANSTSSTSRSPEADSPAIDPWELTELAGGGLSTEPSELPNVSDDLAPAPLMIATQTPTPLPLPRAFEPQPTPAVPLPQETQIDSTPAVQTLSAQWLTQASHFELFQRLHLSDSLDHQRVVDELKQRGFSDEMIELGKGLADNDVANRVATVERLRQGVRFDSLAWLRQAAKDEDLQVRRLALQGLVESRDPIESRMARRTLAELDGNVVR